MHMTWLLYKAVILMHITWLFAQSGHIDAHDMAFAQAVIYGHDMAFAQAVIDGQDVAFIQSRR